MALCEETGVSVPNPRTNVVGEGRHVGDVRYVVALNSGPTRAGRPSLVRSGRISTLLGRAENWLR